MPVDLGMGIHALSWYVEGQMFAWTGTTKGKAMRSYIWVIVALGSMYLVWKGLDFYSDEQKRKHEFSHEKSRINHEQEMQDMELKHAAEESEKDRKLQREIMEHQRTNKNQADPN